MFEVLWKYQPGDETPEHAAFSRAPNGGVVATLTNARELAVITINFDPILSAPKALAITEEVIGLLRAKS